MDSPLRDLTARALQKVSSHEIVGLFKRITFRAVVQDLPSCTWPAGAL